jgi:hypothetical protein
MPVQQADRRRAIESALLDFHRTPGRHTIALRQPALLFASIREVLQLAGERSPDDARSPSSAIVQAARFFVSAALLPPGADHYALLGLTRGADPAAIKERYRAMMRLLHPDFAQSSAGAIWPADAATRINQAYEVLSSPERRRAYDQAIDSAPVPPPLAVSRDLAQAPAARRASAQRRDQPRRVLRRLVAGFGALGGLALAGMWVATAQGERDTLVQRATTRVDKFPALFAAAPAPTATAAPEAGVQAAIAHALPETLSAPALAASAASGRLDAPAPIVSSAAPPAPAEGAAAMAPAPPAPAAAPADSAPVVAQAPTASPAPVPVPGPSIADVQPLLTQLLQEVESGWGDNLIARLDRGARGAAQAQALARQLDALCDGVRPVRIARVAFKGEPRDGRLVVTGQATLQVRDAAAPTRQFALLAEFAERDGAPVLTRLAPAPAPTP